MGEGGSIGTVFAEIDLDNTRYLKSQQQLYKDATTTSLSIEQNFKNLGIKTDAVFDLMRAKIENSYNAIKHSAQATADDIVRAEKAKISKLEDLNRQQFGSHESFLDKLKSNYIAVSVAVTAAIIAIKKAWDFVEWGAKSIQAEESFRRVAFSAGESADKILAAMQKATAGTIDDSDLMQKAVKGITQGLTGEDLIKISEAARVASRALGVEVSEAFERIIDSVANKTPKALKQMGLITTEQMSLFNKAVSSGAENVNLLDIVTANTLKHQEQFGTLIKNNAENMRTFSAVTKNAGEEVAKFFSSTFTEAWNNSEKIRIRNDAVYAQLGRPAKSKAEYEETVVLLKAMGNSGDYALRHLQTGETAIKKTMDSWSKSIEQAKLAEKLKATGESWKTTLQNMQNDVAVSGFADEFQKKMEETHNKAQEYLIKYKGISGARIEIVKWEESEVARIQQESRFHDLDEVRKGNEVKRKESEAMLAQFFKDEDARKEKEIKTAQETAQEILRINKEKLEALRADEEYHYQVKAEQYQIFQDFMNQAGGGELGKDIGFLASVGKGEDQYTQEIERANQHYTDMLAMNQGYWDATTRNAEAAAARDEQIKQATTMRTLSTTSSAFGAMANMAKAYYTASGNENSKAYKLYKAFSKAQIVVDTAKAAIGAYQAMVGIPYVGPILAIAAAAAAIMYGKAQLDAVDAAAPGGGGGGGASAGFSAGSSGGYSYNSAGSIEQKEEIKKEEKTPSRVMNVYIQGDVVTYDQLSRDIIPSLEKAWGDRVGEQ